MNCTRSDAASAQRSLRKWHMVRRAPHLPLTMADIGADAALIIGGARAILLQIAHPSVGRAVAEHSNFAERPLQRLNNTLTFVYALVYGTDDDIRRVTTFVNSAHRAVAGATDAHLQLWVAATLYDTAIQVRELIFGPLDDVSAEAIYREYSIIGTALQMPAELWPADRAEFCRYWRDMLASLEVTDEARRVAHDILHSRSVPGWVRPGMPLLRLITAGLLPAEIRTDFRLPWTANRNRMFSVAIGVLATVYPLAPRRLRYWPRNHYLAVLRSDEGRD